MQITMAVPHVPPGQRKPSAVREQPVLDSVWLEPGLESGMCAPHVRLRKTSRWETFVMVTAWSPLLTRILAGPTGMWEDGVKVGQERKSWQLFSESTNL